jgi:type I phosphodiesterase/nucleotide pyrophosphatase
MPIDAPLLPRYGEASLAEVVPSLLTALDVPGFANTLGIEPVRRVCLLMVDGLGWELLLANRRHAPLLGSLAETAGPLTTGFPATTASSLGSLGTGLPPAGHGLVGYTLALPGFERALNCLRWATYGAGGSADLRERVVPEEFQPQPTAFERAAADGVEVSLVGPPSHARSGLTRAVLRGGRYEDAVSLGDLAAAARRRLDAGRRSLVYAYVADLDLTGHVRGPDSQGWALQLAQVDRLVASLAERLPGDALLVVTGDHGMVTLRQSELIDLADVPELAAGVRLLAGEARARHVHTAIGAARDVLAAWQAILGDRMWVVAGEEAIARGWFGPGMSAGVRARVGDVVAAAHGRVGVVQRELDPSQARMLGHHGSMTAAEQLVPWLLVSGR